jgi:hypothetical protein
MQADDKPATPEQTQACTSKHGRKQNPKQALAQGGLVQEASRGYQNRGTAKYSACSYFPEAEC